jgi:hypothetical protein
VTDFHGVAEFSHLVVKGPHQPFGQLLQRRSDLLQHLPHYSDLEGGLPTSRFSSGEAARRADEVPSTLNTELKS